VFASAVLLMVFVAIGWLVDGVVEIAVALAGADDPLRRWRLTAGVHYVAAAVVVLVWPALSLKTFLSVGAVALIVIGVAQVAVTIGSARAARTHANPPRRRSAIGPTPMLTFASEDVQRRHRSSGAGRCRAATLGGRPGPEITENWKPSRRTNHTEL
jgi:short repeat uncharacterized protein DUF308